MRIHWVFLIFFTNFLVANAFANHEDAQRIRSLCESTISPEAAVQQDLAAFSLPADSLAADLVRLVEYGRLIDQQHLHLEAAGLLVPDGGLCTSGCVGAIRLAYLQPFPLDREIAGSHFDNIVEAVRGLSEIFGQDARLGASAEEAHAYFIKQRFNRQIPNSLHLKFSDEIPDEESFRLPPGSVALLSMDDHTPPGHSVVIAGQIPELRLILLLDPTSPWQLNILSYKYSSMGIEIEEIPSMARSSYVKKMLVITRTGIKN